MAPPSLLTKWDSVRLGLRISLSNKYHANKMEMRGHRLGLEEAAKMTKMFSPFSLRILRLLAISGNYLFCQYL